MLAFGFWLIGGAQPSLAGNQPPSTAPQETFSGGAPATNAAGPASTGGPSAASTGVPSAAGHGEMGTIIDRGTLADLRWPNFSDVRADVAKFYESGGYALVWTTNGQPTPQAQAIIPLLKQSQLKGLNPEDYDASRWDGRLAKLAPATATPAQTDLVDFDIALTVAAMRYIDALHVGRINPQHFKFGLTVGPTKLDLPEFVRNQLLPAQNVAAVVETVERPHAGYRRAEVALAQYLKLAAQGDGDPVPVPAKTVRPGDTYAGIPQLIRRLHLLGDLASSDPASESGTVYQGQVVDAVKHFQTRHGLEPDGLVGKGTIKEINTPLSQRVQELQFTLERYRWLPPDFPQPPILVNIPQFRLRTLRRAGNSLAMNVVVGKAYRTQTPVFSGEMRYVIFRPYWNVPSSIQHAELVPKIARNPAYLAKNNYEVVDGSGNVITDGDVSGEVLGGLRSGAYSIRQKPGPKNALGLVKFLFPNSYNVYLHSTPSVSLFSRARRDFSHGCIRVADPVALAAWVLRDKPGWTVDKIRAAMNGDQTVQVTLDKPIPVLILYSTALVTPEGEVQFFDDIYGYDTKLAKALAAGYPYPS
ncbi:MAG: L,D-transpeptidase family protein [Candidatus Binataceae bacterium]